MYNIRESLENSIKNNTPECVLFSGGIDSSVILYETKKYNNDVKAITVGIKENNCEDISYSKLVASKINADLLVCEADKNHVLSKIDDAVRILKSFNPEWISSTITLLLGVEYAKSIGYSKIGSGEGADDLFGSFPFFRNFNGGKEDLEYIINSRFENIPVMTNVVANAYKSVGITPFRDEEVVNTIKNIPLEERMRKSKSILTKYPLRMSYMGILPYESIVRPQTMAFAGSGIYDILKTIENEVSDNEFNRACKEIFAFKNKLEYALFKKYIKYYKYIKTDNENCIHCCSAILPDRVNCNVCQTVQYKKRELKFNA